jgi:cell division protein FtsB
MPHSQRRPSLGPMIFYSLAFVLASYFTFAAVQGDYGVFRRVRIEADIQQLSAERDQLRGELALLKNKTHRLTDNYLDLDLLDQQVRRVLGYMRADEVVIR